MIAIAIVLTHRIFPAQEVYRSVKMKGAIDIVDGKLGEFAGSMHGDSAPIRFSVGGWPYTYLLKTESDGCPAITTIFWTSLSANIAIWVARSAQSCLRRRRLIRKLSRIDGQNPRGKLGGIGSCRRLYDEGIDHLF